jgi:hypothetical protein
VHREKGHKYTGIITATLLLLGLSAPALAQQRSDVGLRGWGPRVGLADDPDQAILGLHWDIGNVAEHLRFVPNFELGVGDDHLLLVGNAPLHYVFRPVDAGFTPYAGGALSVGLVDHDHRRNRGRFGDDGDDDTDFELAIKAIGGLEWRLNQRTDFLVELNLVFGDLHDVQVLAGWTFKSRR